jgi:hypothetical protein
MEDKYLVWAITWSQQARVYRTDDPAEAVRAATCATRNGAQRVGVVRVGECVLLDSAIPSLPR